MTQLMRTFVASEDATSWSLEDAGLLLVRRPLRISVATAARRYVSTTKRCRVVKKRPSVMEQDAQAPLLAAHGIAARTVRKLDRRVLPLTLGVVFLAYMNRCNIGFAARDLCNDMGLNHQEYGMGVSLFYAGYLLTQIPSNAVLKRVGAPIWLAVIMSAWGAAATGMGLVQNKTQFYVLRFALGLTGGGMFPGVFCYLSLFYPDSYLSGAYSAAVAALVLALPISSPVSAGLLSVDGLFGLEGWRLLLIVEGLVPISYAALLYALLPRSPERSAFLQEEEKDWIASEHSKHPTGSDASLWEDLKVIVSKRVWWSLSVAGLIGFGVEDCLMFWVTLMIDEMLHGDDTDDDSKTCGSKRGSKAAAALLTSIPYLVASVVCMCARLYLNKDRTPSRSKFVSRTQFCAGFCLVAWVGTSKLSFATGFVSLVFTIACSHAGFGALVGLVVSQYDRSVGPSITAVFNTSISFGPIIFPHVIGALLDSYGYGAGNVFLGSGLLLAGILVAFVLDPLANSDTKHDADPGLPSDC